MNLSGLNGVFKGEGKLIKIEILFYVENYDAVQCVRGLKKNELVKKLQNNIIITIITIIIGVVFAW